MGHMLPQLRMCKDFRMTLSLNLWNCLPVSIKFVNFASLIWFHFNHQPNRSWSFNRKLLHLRKAALSWLSTAQPSFNNDLQRNHLVPLITSRLFWIYISPYKNFALKTVFYDFKGYFLKDCNIYWFDECDSYFLPRLYAFAFYTLTYSSNLLVYKLKYWSQPLPLWEEDSPKCRRIIE